ncbi:MAG: hypothetical protein FJY98_02860 [Candidatus Liptonbacteria bacterium]|nr:hypothetical protein [Candidatus Liptonbacteria bacterium]
MPFKEDKSAEAVKTEYLIKLRTRKKESHVYSRFQLIGLQLADLLHDRTHKALYIKLAKERDSEALLSLAKRIAEQTHIQNKGAYFMSCLSEIKPKKSKRNAAHHR